MEKKELITAAIAIFVLVVIIYFTRSNLYHNGGDVSNMVCRSSYDYDEDGWPDSMDSCICNENINNDCETACEDPQKRQEMSEERDRIVCSAESTSSTLET